ncbi:hypothetical protein WICMUC_003427 [Wickerhamomyces mucosus]|uniref:Uncharacterized protein n=1 Tax=Wickerhamomyces mucosus TaxID=1378264 RepID=A0A9P8PMD7_9ASCO|nr:hypothetical protein WICMUC_003427 [Wickerhamomyces mucosus]
MLVVYFENLVIEIEFVVEEQLMDYKFEDIHGIEEVDVGGSDVDVAAVDIGVVEVGIAVAVNDNSVIFPGYR